MSIAGLGESACTGTLTIFLILKIILPDNENALS